MHTHTNHGSKVLINMQTKKKKKISQGSQVNSKMIQRIKTDHTPKFGENKGSTFLV